jgi:FAD-linked sulfhydryl oxidase
MDNEKTRFKLKAIRNNIPYRPSGYYDDVVSKGIIIDDYVEMPFQEALKLIEKYSEKSPINGVELDASKWGPILWKTFHDRTKQYDGVSIEAEKRWFYKVFGSWIPCGKCRNHLNEIISEMPPSLESRESYVKWGIDIHNEVNKHLGKTIFDPEKENE